MNRLPQSTYRLQFNRNFNFIRASEIVDYLSCLGITYCYASPLFRAKEGSIHGYDLVDHSELNPEIGSEEEFENFHNSLKKFGIGLIFDIVPNHMFIFDRANKWWQDVLENGPSSRFAGYFDIDWHPARHQMENKVLLPLLDQQFGEALENQKIKVIYQDGAFYVECMGSVVLPTDPKTWLLIFNSLEIEGIDIADLIFSIEHLNPPCEGSKKIEEERKLKIEEIKAALANLFQSDKKFSEMLKDNLAKLNGVPGVPASFDLLENFLNEQPYRLCFWRVALDEINYRRFFDILDLAGIRTEKKEVFEAIHRKIFEYIEKGWVSGLRIDHIDGLWDPEQYLYDLQQGCKTAAKNQDSFYIVAEKILIGNEKLLNEWLLNGTVGYDFLNQAGGLFVQSENRRELIDTYQRFTGLKTAVFDLLYECKELILFNSLSSELTMLARCLDRISQQHRSTRDFTLESLKAAIRDVISSFPVYRSYIRTSIEKIHPEDKKTILTAIFFARRKNPSLSGSIFDFLQKVLLLEHPEGISEEEKREREKFVMRFQQLTPPVMAKGVEDTAFYRYYPLSSLMEVGADLTSFGINIESFHRKNRDRADFWPHTMLTTSTHDTKRGEDVRARIHVLSEIPDQWEEELSLWSNLNLKYKTKIEEDLIPDSNEEYLIYQTIIGTYPLEKREIDYEERIQRYIEKALREAKIHTSWVNSNHEYEEAVAYYISKLLEETEGNEFLTRLNTFIKKIICPGLMNSLSQVVLKFTSPGVPDIYQGNEMWDFSLVDPDNRREVDYQKRKMALLSLKKNWKDPEKILLECLNSFEDGRIKLYLTAKILELRNHQNDLFTKGSYVPLEVFGPRKDNLIAFARVFQDQCAIVIAARFFYGLLEEGKMRAKEGIWLGTTVDFPENLPQGNYCNLLTGERRSLPIELEKSLCHIPLAVFNHG